MHQHLRGTTGKPLHLNRLGQTGILVLIICAMTFQLTACGLVFGHKAFVNALAEGKIKQGLTKQEILEIVGEPDSQSASKINGHRVDIWFYRQTSKADEYEYEKTFIETLGLGGYGYVHHTESHLVVFRNDRVIGWDRELVPREPSKSVPVQKSVPLRARGTGFMVGNGHMLTNYHTIEHMTSMIAQLNGHAYPAAVLFEDKADGVAVLKVPTDVFGHQGLALGDSVTVGVGEKVWTLGYPLSGRLGKKPVITEGTITNLLGPGQDPRFFQVSIPIQPGNSGEPLFNQQGEVIGIHIIPLDLPKVFPAWNAIPSQTKIALKINFAKRLLSKISEISPVQASIPTRKPKDYPAVLDLLYNAEPLVIEIRGTRE